MYVALQIETPTSNVHSIASRERETIKRQKCSINCYYKITDHIVVGNWNECECECGMSLRAAFVRNINRHYKSPLRSMLMRRLLELLNISNTSIRQLNRLKTFKMIFLNYSMLCMLCGGIPAYICLWIFMGCLIRVFFSFFRVVQVTFLRLLLSDVFQSCIVVAISVLSQAFHRAQLFTAMHRLIHVCIGEQQ